jgi:hypothetical protein
MNDEGSKNQGVTLIITAAKNYIEQMKWTSTYPGESACLEVMIMTILSEIWKDMNWFY